MTDFLLKTEKLAISIQNHILLKDVSIEINPHDFLFVTGNNGSGKSTFMNIIAKYQPPESAIYSVSGKLEYNGNKDYPSYNLLSKRESQWYNREICYLKQNAELHGTIFQNFQIVLEPIKKIVTKSEVLKEFQKYGVFKERLENNQKRKWFQKDFLDQPINSLSGGQRKIIEILAMIMRARISSIKLLLIDEPFNHLDVKNIKKVVELILEIRKINPDLAIVVSTHCMAFPSPCAGIGDKNQIEKEHFKHYVVTDETIRPASEDEPYKQGSCFLDAL